MRLDDTASFSFFFRYRDESTTTTQPPGQSSSPTTAAADEPLPPLVFVEVRTAQGASAALMEFSIFFLVPQSTASTSSNEDTSRSQESRDRTYDQAHVISQAMHTFQQLVMASSSANREDGEGDVMTEDDLRRLHDLVDFLVAGQRRPNAGLDAARLAELKERGWSEADGARCAICLEPFAIDDTLRSIPCSHAFHTACLDAWLQRVNSCPLCRLAVVDPS